MVSDRQVARLWRLVQTELTLEVAAAKAGMDPKTARKYLRDRRLASEMKQKHEWRTRLDPFAGVWEEVRERLEVEPGLQAKTLFEHLQQTQPGQFNDGQLRTLPRRIKQWRATEGPAKEVFFAQEHQPGELCQSDFTHCRELGITIAGAAFPHLIYHFVLSYSNWETGSICYSESFASLSAGLQKALWELGGVPKEHRSDRMSAAVNNLTDQKEFTQAYESLLAHYGLGGQKIQAGRANENGDVEQRHYRFKQAVGQALMMRGSRDFASVAEYEEFLRKLFARLNAGRRARLAEEMRVLHALPERRLDTTRRMRVRVSPGSLIQVHRNSYSVRSGKTHLLCAIGQELIARGRRVYFTTSALLVQDLLVAKRDLKLSRFFKRLAYFEGLIIDDLGYVQQSREEMEVLFTLLAERYERGSVMISSNLPFSKWEGIFKDAMTTAAAIDRLVHHCVILELNIPSYRVEQAKKAKDEKPV